VTAICIRADSPCSAPPRQSRGPRLVVSSCRSCLSTVNVKVSGNQPTI
jgi:hypothetical protein